MADISQHLKAIKTAKYGEEVRGSIHDALEAMNGTKVDKDELNLKLLYGTTDVYVLQEGIDITIKNNVVTNLLKSDFSNYDTVAFPEGITEINLGIQENSYWHGQPFIANKVIMPLTLKRIEMDSFTNDIIFNDDERFDESSPTIKTQGDYVWDDASVIVRVKEFVLNEGLEEPRLEFYNNIYLEKINIPSNWERIYNILYNCINLKTLVIPATIKKIYFDGLGFALHGYNDVVYGYGGTAAEAWAKESNITFVNIGSDYTEEIEKLKNDKVDKIDGKGLSTEDFTTEDKKRLEGLDENGNFGNGHNINHGKSHLVSGSNNTIDGGWVVTLLGSQLKHFAGNQAFLTGYNNINSGGYAVIGGNGINSNGIYNVVLGLSLTALKGYSVLLGNNLTAEQSYCNLIGDHLTAKGYRKTILGRYNVPSDNPFVVAFGSDDENRKNIFEVTSNGKAISKEVETEDVILKSPNGKKFKITVSDTGELITTKI